MRPIIGPLASLMYSRKALIATVDALAALAAVLITAYLAPAHVQTALALVAILQPLAIVWIMAIAKEDAAEKSWSRQYYPTTELLPGIIEERFAGKDAE